MLVRLFKRKISSDYSARFLQPSRNVFSNKRHHRFVLLRKRIHAAKSGSNQIRTFPCIVALVFLARQYLKKKEVRLDKWPIPSIHLLEKPHF
jgi:hypothetical protein